MAYRSLRRVGRTKFDLLQSKLQADLDQWSKEWSASGSVLAITQYTADCVDCNDFSWTHMELPNRSITVGITKNGYALLAEHLAKTTSRCSSGLSERIGERALHALCAIWLQEDVQQVKYQSIKPPESSAVNEACGDTAIVITGDGFRLVVVMPLVFIDYFIQRSPSNKVAVVSAHDAVLQEQVALKVVLDLGMASVSNAYHLKVGDVLLSSAPLNSNFHLQNLEGKEIAAVKLFKTNMTRSIQIHSTVGATC